MAGVTLLHCPRCGSDRIRGGKCKVAGGTVYDYWCSACSLLESRISGDDDLSEWSCRWESLNPDYVRPRYRPRRKRPDRCCYPVSGSQEWCFDRVVAAPEHDEPRRKYAEVTDEPGRAEFIHLQLARFKAEREAGALVGAPSAREQELLAEHGKRWAGQAVRPARGVRGFPGYAFERGFVAHLRTDAAMVTRSDGYLYAVAPIEHLDLTPGGPIREAITAEFCYFLRSINLSRLGLTDDDVIAMAEQGRLDQCEYLDLRGNMITETGVAALAAAAQVRAIRMVLLAANPVSVSYLADALEERHGRIDWLHLAPDDQPDRFHATGARYT